MGIFGNGTSLVENLVPSGLANVATRLVEAIAINSISEKARRGRTLVVKRGTVTRRMLVAAATEFRRAHRFWSDEFHGCWSHGDGTTQNVFYDPKTDRARLIDFEIVHEKSLATAARQADDLLVFLLDMVGIVPSRQWLPFSMTFLEAYSDVRVIAQLRKQLDLPGGLAWIWWVVRTNFTNAGKVKQRLASLSRAIAKLK